MRDILLASWSIIWWIAVVLFVVSLVLKRNDIADIAWWWVYVILALYYLFVYGWNERAILMYGLVMLWWIRLAIHIYLKNKNKSEDFRYAQRRKDRGKRFYLRSFLQIYLLQGFLIWVIIFPLMLFAVNDSVVLEFTDIMSIGLWIFWFYFQVVWDRQLAQFKKDPKNKWKVLQTWLWKYSRHPNYFGEVTMRWAIFFLCAWVVNGRMWIGSPITITILILFVSGVPMLEKKYEGNPKYEEYKKRTSMFIPLPPKWWDEEK